MLKSFLIITFLTLGFLGCFRQGDVEQPVIPVQESVVSQAEKTTDLVESPSLEEAITLPDSAPNEWVAEPIVSEADFKDVFISAPRDRDLASCYEEICFHDELQIVGEYLFLKGIGTRKILTFDIYTAAFYLSLEGSADIEAMTRYPVAMVLEYRRDIEKKKVIETIYDNIAANPKVDLEKVRPQFKELSAAFDPPDKGSRYEFIYLPDYGFTMMKDGEVKVTLPGEDFAYAFFGIWFGDHLEDTKMKQYLLGLRKP